MRSVHFFERRPEALPITTPPDRENAVRQKLQRLDGVDASNVEIENQNETLAVTGTVNRLPDNDRILEAIGAIRGVENVIVSLTVKPEQRPDNAVEQDVITVLKADPAMANVEPNVSVETGIVTLPEKAQSWAEKRPARQPHFASVHSPLPRQGPGACTDGTSISALRRNARSSV